MRFVENVKVMLLSGSPLIGVLAHKMTRFVQLAHSELCSYHDEEIIFLFLFPLWDKWNE